MSGHDESSTTSLKCPSLFKKTGGVPSNLIESTIKSDLLSKPLGSHEALHFFLEELRKENTHYSIKKAIENVLRSPSLRQEIEVKWNISDEYGRAKTCERMMDKGTFCDLASWSIENCPPCFNVLLDHQTVQPSPYFFWLAFKSDKHDLAQRVLSLMDPKDLLSPIPTGFRIAYEIQHTVFQVATWKQKWFQICWTRLKQLPNNGLASLGPAEARNLWRFANVALVNELLKAGLDLGKFPGWLEIIGRTDPEPMFNWLLSRGHQPPGNLLTDAAAHNCIHAARWLMCHDKYTQDWREAIYVAAESTDNRSAEMMAIILHGSAAKLRADPTASQNIVIKVVNGACQEREKYNALAFPFSSGGIYQKPIEDIERVAVQKMKALGEVVGEVEVIGTKINAKKAGFAHLAEALGK